ncbi:MAG: four helix bundle protein [Chloroflexi bacterium]|nr:MAG: four helix bundle protein [Chloroflexota bacterium]
MGQPIRSHRDLIVWQRAVQFAVRVYQVTDGYPKREVYGLTDQTRRSVVSIAANIAEGHGRRSDGAFANYLSIAMGSTAELDTHLQIALEIGYLSEDDHQELVAELTEITKMLHGLYRTVRQ